MKTVLLFVVLVCVAIIGTIQACDKKLCASLVSGCQLIKACDCDMENKKNCSCCYNCQLCLGNLYMQCCSCVGMCPLPNPEDSLFRTSTIEVLNDPIPDLFSVLTEEEDYLKRWTTYRYPIYFDSLYSRETNMEPGLEKQQDEIVHFESRRNCTVAFMSECMPMSQCKQSCRSMGAAKFRWFHDQGCCQCIEKPCQDFGLNEAKCLKCRSEDDNDNNTPGENEDILEEEEENLRHGHHQHHHGHHAHHHKQTTENV